MSNIAIFTFENSQVRTALKGNEPYFCLIDVSVILGLQNGKADRFNLDEKGIEKIQITDSLNRKQTATFISEPNLYRVIFRSNKAEAVKFQNWVFDEVLPSIRKNGTYTTKSTAHDRTPLRQAVTALTAKFGLMHDEAYRLVHQYMGVNSIDEIALDDLPKAVAYVHSLLLSTHNNDQNAFWQMVGLLEHERISGEIRQLNDTINQAERLIRQARVQINQLNTGTGLLYDAFGEQYLPTKVPVLDKAQAFIDRQMAMKKKIGLIS
ncbi:Bro-N domain-containing protein [Moraxella bovis]|uniref:BRO-N domain-containing protein n=1 Tax=Moraxella bovis TaxID=476 RepID=UPI0022263419|nr:Bro-N domain-containing protein [Moraxella bovis]UZA25323.1 Bro-N domain-containing protein [Moraxella bovis]UZA29186.1 Bro-N domain-containing protein [Moraxella bovis]